MVRTVAVPLVLLGAVSACGDDDASVSFVAPVDGATIAGGVPVELAAEGVTIEPAGEVRDGAGHLHVIADRGCVAAGEAIPRDVDHVHLGMGQADGMVYLGPGTHELCVQVGDGAHIASEVTRTITVEVGIDDQEQWCSVVEQVDERFEEVDSSDDEFAVKQADYAGIGRLLDQLIAGLDHVEAAARVDVGGAAEGAKVITDAYADAVDEAEAAEKLEAAFEAEQPSGAAAAAAWILDTCDVDIDG